MFLADKIINLRKKAGWSQEELAGRLGVTRQSVSKCEVAHRIKRSAQQIVFCLERFFIKV